MITSLKSRFFSNSKLTVILLSAFSSGLPFALVTTTLQAWFTTSNINLLSIGVLTLVGQPYLYKFLWAPLLDRFIPNRLGKRRSWILLMQLALALSIASIAFCDPKNMATIMASLALLIAFFSATQDIAVDAYATELLDENERGMGAALKTMSYRVAMLVSGAGALILAAKWGWKFTYLSMAVLMILCAWITYKSPTADPITETPRTLKLAIIEPWKEFMSRNNAMLILIFIAIYKLSDAMALSLNMTFLIRGIGFSLFDVGSISKTIGLGAAFLGSLLGGILYPRLGMYRSLLYFGFLQMAANLSFAYLAVIGKNYWIMSTTIFSEYFFGGLSTVAFLAFLMSLCNRKYTATQFALFSAVATAARVFIGPEAAMMVEHLGWMQFYIWTFLLGFPSLFLLFYLREQFCIESLLRTH